MRRSTVPGVPFEKSFDQLVTQALLEDLISGDITSDATVPEETMAIAEAISKSPLVLSGGEIFSRCFHAVDSGTRIEQIVPDGQLCPPGAVLLRAEGSARSLLKAERTALNFLQRMSGIATLTRSFVDAAEGKLRICDTRKTTPLLRVLERKAVRDGGGFNHRDNLGSAVLIKDNHIAASGGISAAVSQARTWAPHTSKIEVEVTTLEQVDEALAAGADILLLDNFSDELTTVAITKIAGRAFVELSGNMSLARVAQLKDSGADAISIGALTHSAPAADISLRLRRVEDDAPLLNA